MRAILLHLLCTLALGAGAPAARADDEGIRFACPAAERAAIKAGLPTYLAALDIDAAWLREEENAQRGTLLLRLNGDEGDAGTLGLSRRPELRIADEVVGPPGRARRTVSRKEILLALLQRGRLTEFSGRDCRLEALQEHVGVRQNVVRWAEDLNWVWPDGGAARWNGKYWRHGTPRPGVALANAVEDLFRQPQQYAIGCYTAAKVTMIQGVLDYYRRVSPDAQALKTVEARLLADGEPLLDVEPGSMWRFEADFPAAEASRPGKILSIQHGVAAGNFVPGDWVYLLNTDPRSRRKTGYEGANAIYLGGNRFVDYFNDHHHAYTWQEKANEVFQWRHGVFSRRRDAHKAVPLSGKQLHQLLRTPAEGGLLMDFRVFPTLFGTPG